MKNSHIRSVLRQMKNETAAPPPKLKVQKVLKCAINMGLNVYLDMHRKDFGKISADLLNPENWSGRIRPADTVASAEHLDEARRQHAKKKDEIFTANSIELPNDFDA
jgi:hypothetical protein